MTTPTVPVTVTLTSIGGPAKAGITVTAKLDRNEVYQGIVISDKVEGVTDANGVAVLDCFPNAPDPAGLGTMGSTYRFTAKIPNARELNARARVPNEACRLESILVLDSGIGLDEAQLALSQVQGLATTVQGLADAAAGSADEAAESAQQAMQGKEAIDEFVSEFGTLTGAIEAVQQVGAEVDLDKIATAADRVQTGLDVVAAGVAKTGAETARDQSYAAGRVYEDAATGDGDAGLSNGDYFYVISAEDAEVYELWQKDGAGGTDTGKRSPSNAAISSVAAAVTVETERATAAEDGLREDTDFLLDQFSMSMTSALAGSASALPSNPLSYRRMTLPDGTRVAVPVYTVVEPLDLFVIVGQSNAEGRGDSAQSPAAPEGVYINGSTISAPLADPVGGASTGSMWPAWSNEWFARTGRMSAFVEAAVGGTALLPDDSAPWSPAGSLRGIAVTAASNAISAINGSSSYTLGNVYFVWSQGESDAVNTNGTTVTAALYTDALKTLATYFKAQIPAMVKMFVVTTGLNSTSGPTISQQTLNYAAIRGAQVIAASEDANIEIVYSGTPGFIAAGMMADGQHYSQTGLNIAGKLGAASASGASITPAALNRLAATSYADASDANKSSRTLVHTAQTAAKSVLLLVHGTRNSIPTITATYAGETMTNVGRAQFLDSGTATVVAAFLYNDADGVGSGSIVVSSSSALLSAHCEVLEFDAPAWVEGLGSNLTTVSDTSQSHEVVVAQPAQLVTAVGSVSAAASSVTFTGATELHEASLLRTSVSTYYTFAVAAEEVTQTETISTTHSTTCTHINALSIALRRVHTDEA